MAKRSHIMVSLVRCGETKWTREGRLQGATDLPLNDEGRAAAAHDASGLARTKIATVYHPPDEAATETAQEIARVTGAKTRAVADLAEPDLGLFEGLLLSDLQERYPKRYKQWQDDPASLLPPEGEAIADGRDRVFRALAKVLRKSRASEVAIVLHTLGYGFLRCWIEDLPAESMWRAMKDDDRVQRYAVGLGLLEPLGQATKTPLVETTARGEGPPRA